MIHAISISPTFKPDLKAAQRIRMVSVELYSDVAAVDHKVDTTFAAKWFDELRRQGTSVDLQ